MASGIGLSLDTSFLQSLANADQKIKDLTNKTNHLSRVTVQAFQQMANGGVAPYIEQLNRQKKALEEIGKIKGTSPLLTQMQADAKIVVDEINRVIKALEKTKAYKGEMSGKKAISFANSVLGQRGEAKSIDNMKLAINQLEAAQNRLNLNTKTGQKNYEKIGKTIEKVKTELNKATGANKELTDESKKTSDAVSGIGRNISIAFALNAIKTFTKQLIDVRGEFELQHRSLQVLLQDVDEANALWEKTTALAVKSPYRVKELVTYTKQLAAYRVEADKLYDTTRMLADVSSGLGVDMNRLILAFGQVKAANFLRGTELRQFSEAGVNLLEELSKRFTQLEGRAVSVGDVFERVSKRMVSFADVEAVFQTITSEGGVFYQMQEKQSETLRGMWMNLMDSIDLALNDIGLNGSDILKGAVKLTKDIVDNWRKLVPIIAGAGTTLFAYFSVASLTAIGKAVGALVNPWALVAGAVAGLTVGIISAIKAQRELTAEMNRIDTEVRGQLENSTALYMKLTKAVNDVTSSEKERNKALDQLKAKFADILPDQMLELEYIQGIADNYSEATDAMINYYTAKSREQKKDKVESHYAEEIEGTDIPELVTATRNAINKLGEKGIISSDMQLALLGSIKHALNIVTEKVKGGEISAEYNSMRNAIFSELEKYSGYEGSLFDDLLNINTVVFDEQVKDISTTLSGLRRDLENIPQFSFGSYAKDEAAKAFLPEKENIEQAKEVFKSMINEFALLSQQTVDTWNGADEAIFDMISKLPPEMSAYAGLLSQMFEKLKIEATKGGFEFKAAIQGLQQDFTSGLPNALWSQTYGNMFGPMSEGIRAELSQMVTNAQDTLNEEAKGLELTDFQNSVIDVFRNVSKEVKGADLNVFKDFIPDLKKSRGEIIKELNALETQYTDTVAAFEKSLSEGVSPMMAELIHQVTEEEIAWMKTNIPALDKAAKKLGELEKKKTRTDNTIEERIKVVDQMNKKYLELNKTLSKTESLQGAFDAYKDAFATAYGREDVRTMKVEDFVKNVLNFPNEDDIVKWFDELEKTVAKKEDKIKVQLAKGKFVMDIEVRAKKEKDQELFEEIQNMFDQYDLSLELKKLNIAPDVAKSLFGIESLGLEDIRKKVESELASAKTVEGNEDRIKQLEKDLEKINDMEDKAQIERLQKYLKYTREAIGERAQIKIEEMNKLQEIEETFDKAIAEAKTEEDKKRIEEQRKLAQEGVKRESSEKTKKLDWEDFKSSDTFINLFNDIDNASSDLINHAITQIQKFKNEWTDMPVESAKEMAQKLNDLQLALMDTDRPLKDNKKLWAELGEEMEKRGIEGRPRNAKAQAKLAEEVTSENKGYEKEIALGKERITILETINNLNSENKAQKLEELGITEDSISALGLSKDVLTNTVKVNNDLIKGEKTQIKNTNDKIEANRKVLNTQKKISQNAQELNEGINVAKTLSNDLYGAFKDLYKALGGDDDGPVAIFADMGMSMANTVLDTIMLIVQMNAATIAAQGLGAAMKSASGIIGWIVMAIEILVQAISAAVNYAEKLRQMELDILIGQVENLRKKYDELAESIDKAYSTKQLQEYSKELERLHGKMEDAQKDYIKLLESSDKDKDTINIAKEAQEKLDNGLSVGDLSKKERKALLSEEYKDYKEATDALAEMQKDHEEQKKDLLESMGGVTDYKSAAQDFVDAWVDAFRETGDGLSGLQENFREFFDDVIKQEAMRRVTDKYMQPFFDDLNAALEEGHGLNEAEIADLKAKADKVAPELSRILEELWTALGGSMENASGGQLSALQKGIQGITEDTAQVIESYLNSIRGYVSEQVTHTKNIYNILYDATRHENHAIWVKLAR